MLLINTKWSQGRPSKIRIQESLAAPPSGKCTMTSYSATGKSWIYWERCMVDAWFLLNTNVKLWSLFQKPHSWINCSGLLRRWRHSIIYGLKQNLLIRKTAKLCKKTSSLSTAVRPTRTHIKQQQYFWHPTSRRHIVLLLIYAIRPCLTTVDKLKVFLT